MDHRGSNQTLDQFQYYIMTPRAFDNFFRLAGERALSEALSKMRLAQVQALYDRVPPPVINFLRYCKRIIRR